MTHTWRWSTTKLGINEQLIGRKNALCKLLATGRNGNVLVEFADGYRVIAPRWAIRKIQA